MSTLQSPSALRKIGIPPHLFWGYVGVLIFMMGDGLEIGWLSPFLVEEGFTVQQTSMLFSAYGLTIALSSWFSGVFVEAFGPKRTMFAGFILYVLATIGFITLGISQMNYSMMLAFYALRGFGYPLFAYSFLVWVTYRTPANDLGKAVGWFWFVFTGGLNVLGAYFSVWSINTLGYIGTLWTALLWVSIGAIFALIINRDVLVRKSDASAKGKAKELLKGLTIVKREPKVALGGVVRMINTTSQFAFPVFLPLYLASYGIPTSSWLTIWGAIFLSNIVFNLVAGFIGDKIGWQNTIIWFGGVGAGVTTLLLYYAPQLFGGNLIVITIVGMLWGASLAAYVPLSALVPSLVKGDKGAAMSILNLGAGLPVFVGPAIVGLFIGIVGDVGVMWILALLHFASSIITKFITLPDKISEQEVA